MWSRMFIRGLPGGSVVNNSPENLGDMGLIWEIPQALEQVSLCTTWEPQLLKPRRPRACVPQQEKPPQWEAFALYLEKSPCLPQLEKKLSQQWRSSILLLLLSRFSHVRLCVTPWTAAYQASLSMGFSRQEHWSGLPFSSPEDLA